MRFQGVSAGRRLMMVLAALAVLTALLLSLTTATLAKDRRDGEGRRGFSVEEGFRDLGEAAWAEKYIRVAQMRAFIRGYDDGTFRPNQPLNRQEAVVMVVRAMGLEDEAQSVADQVYNQVYNVGLSFRDADQIGSWAIGYVRVALDRGLIDGGDGMFQPHKAAGRVWIIPVLVRAMGLGDEARARVDERLGFTDAAAIPPAAAGYISVAIDTGLVSGFEDGAFRPFQPVTRAQMAKLLEVLNAEIQPATQAPKRYNVKGVIVEVDAAAARLTLRTMQHRQPAVYGVVYNAPVYLDSRPAALADLHPGFLAEVFLNDGGQVVFVDARSRPAQDLRHLLTRGHPRQDEVKGTVVSTIYATVDAAGLKIIVDTGRGEVTLAVAPDAVVELPDDTWGTLEDIAVGDFVEVKVRGGIAVAIEVKVGVNDGKGPGRGRGKGNGKQGRD